MDTETKSSPPPRAVVHAHKLAAREVDAFESLNLGADGQGGIEKS